MPNNDNQYYSIGTGIYTPDDAAISPYVAAPTKNQDKYSASEVMGGTFYNEPGTKNIYHKSSDNKYQWANDYDPDKPLWTHNWQNMSGGTSSLGTDKRFPVYDPEMSSEHYEQYRKLVSGESGQQQQQKQKSQSVDVNENPIPGILEYQKKDTYVPSSNYSDNLSEIGNDIYNKDLQNIQQSKNFMIGNAIGQGVLNIANLSNAWAKPPKKIGAPVISNEEYNSPRAGELADIENSVGKYRSGIRREIAENGMHPSTMIGAEANVLDSELKARAGVSEEINKQNIEQVNANKGIEKENAGAIYNADIMNTQRNDKIEETRSGLVQQGLSNFNQIGSTLASTMIKLNSAKNNEEAYKYWVDSMANAKNMQERMMLMQWGTSRGYTSTSWSGDMSAYKKDQEK